MKSFDFWAVVYDGAVYCVDCSPVDVDSEDVSPIFADQEWDYVPVCDVCGRLHDYVILLAEETPEPDDLVISPTGPLGSGTLLSVVDGPVLGEYSTEEEALQAAREYCQREGYWPDVWSLSDHGNWHRIQNIREVSDHA